MLELNWEDISARIKSLRKSNRITIERLSELIGASPTFIGLVERGESGISIDNLYKLSQIFNVSVDFLLTGQESASISNAYERFGKLNATLFDYTDEEVAFLIELSKFLKTRVSVK